MAPLPDSRAARAHILGALRAAAPTEALPRPSLAPYLGGPWARGASGPQPDPVDLVEPFERAARGWRAEVLHADLHHWPQAVRQALDQHGCRRIAMGAASAWLPGLAPALAGLTLRRFDQPLEAWKAELFDSIDAGITGCDAGIADTGTLLLRPGPGEPRTLSLVPPLHIALLRMSQLHASLAAAVGALQPQASLPSNLVLITGPSKTSDIQQTLAYGAHGPKALVIVLVHDLGPSVTTSQEPTR